MNRASLFWSSTHYSRGLLVESFTVLISVYNHLTRQEEKELVDFLITCSKMGYGKTRSHVFRKANADTH